MNLSDYPDDDHVWRSSTICHCGADKACSAHACPRCTYLDGGTPKQSRVIEALRDGGMGIRDLCESVDGECTRVSRRAMFGTIAALEAAGRIRRYWQEMDAVPMVTRRWGGERMVSSTGNGRWMYVLCGRWREVPLAQRNEDAQRRAMERHRAA